MTHTLSAVSATVRRIIVFGVAAAALSACASGTGGSAASPAQAGSPSPAAATSSRYVLVQADLQGAKSDNLYDAIKKLRPEFINGRTDMTYVPPGGAGPTSTSKASGYVGATDGVAILPGQAAVMVYMDGAKLNGVDDLKQMSAAGVREVRFLQGKDAVIRFGANHAGGAILITSVK